MRGAEYEEKDFRLASYTKDIVTVPREICGMGRRGGGWYRVVLVVLWQFESVNTVSRMIWFHLMFSLYNANKTNLH